MPNNQKTQLSEIIKILAPGIEKMMGALFDLQKSILRAEDQTILARFEPIRKNLIAYIETISNLMSKIWAHGGNVIRLQDNTTSASPAQVLLLLQQLVEKCKKFQNLVNTAPKMHMIAIRTYDASAETFKVTLLTVTSKEERENGQQAMVQFEEGCDELQRAMKNLCSFFTAQTHDCERYWKEAQQAKVSSASITKATVIAIDWKADRESAMQAHTQIKRYCDHLWPASTSALNNPSSTAKPPTPDPDPIPNPESKSGEYPCSATGISPDTLTRTPGNKLSLQTSLDVSTTTPDVASSPASERSMQEFGTLLMQSRDYQTLIKVARESFGIIEPWANASSEEEIVQRIFMSMRDEAQSFFRAINMSLNNAQSGYHFALEASRLCSWLLEPIETHTNEAIRANIKAMRRNVHGSYDEVELTAEKFRANRRGFSRITGQIPEALQAVKLEQARIEASRDGAERRSETWGWLFSTKSKRNLKVSRNILKVAAALTILPVGLPVALVAKAQIKDREQQLIHLNEEMKQLEGAAIALNELMENLDVLAAYWLKMNAVLEDIHFRVGDVRNDILLQLKVKDRKQDWEQVGGQFLAYRAELMNIMDYSKAAATIGSASQQTNRRK